MNVFEKLQTKAYPIAFAATIHVDRIVGGVPSDPKIAEGWIKSKWMDHDDMIRQAVADTMTERGITSEEAAEEVNKNKHLNGFKKDENGLYIEGRQLKAALKEAVSVAIAAEKIIQTGWGKTKKYLSSYLVEHVFIPETKLYLGVTEPTDIMQHFVHVYKNSGIKYEEYVDNVDINFTVETDHDFTFEQWGMMWLTGGRQGLGASRSQGFGTYEVTRWEKIRDGKAPSHTRERKTDADTE